MPEDFLHTTLGKIATPVFRLGLAATYRPGKRTIYKALDEGINYLFYFGIDTHMTSVLREVVKSRRDRYVIATGAYNYIWWQQDLRRTLERRLRQIGTDYIDVFHFLGVMKPKEFTPRVREQLEAVRRSGLVRAVSLSTHDRKFAADLAAEGAIDAMMIRYNAAHRGAEEEIFPRLPASDPAVISYTATRWRYLIRRPRGYPKDGRIPTPGMCYRFVLSNPHVDVCLTAPSNQKQLEENLAAVRQGPLDDSEMSFMRDFGDVVHRQYKRFM
jgi:aryl-alcohol dehydrogenase-like predicted oxidoreductase